MASISPRHAAPDSEVRAGQEPAPAVADAPDAPKGVTAEDGPGAPAHGHALTSGPRPRRARAGRPLPLPLPRSNVVLVVAGVHAALTVAAALVGATLVLVGSPFWIWALLLAAIAGAGGWVAYVGVQVRRWRKLVPAALVCSHLGLLAWVLAVVGPHLSLLLLVPGAAFLALRIGGRTAAVGLVCAACAVFVADVVLSLVSGLAPVASLNTPLDTLLDASASASGLALALAGAFDATAGRARAELLARVRQGEARRLQVCIDRLRHQAEDDAEALYRALDAAREGRPLEVSVVDGVFSPVIGGIAALGEHVADLQDEVRAGNKVEAALGQLTLTLERSWLGLTWSWPSPTGTPVDDIVALLRTPSPRQLAPLLADDQPTGPIPVPTDPEMPARRRVIPAPRSNPHLDGLSLHGADQQPGAAQAHAYPERRPADRRTSPLRWQDWDDWRGWQAD